MNSAYHTSCLVCEEQNIRSLSGYEKHDLVKCPDCGFVFMRKIPTQEELLNYYSVYAYREEKAIPDTTKMSIESLVNRFERYRKNNRILDVGCGEGWILEIAKSRGWEVYGTEFSQRAIEICERKGIKMFTGVLKADHMDVREFDIIISSETIEHINNPLEEFRDIYKLLRTGGLLYVTTPNFNSYLRIILKDRYNIIIYPEHLSYYTIKTMNTLLTKLGFRKRRLLTTGISLTRFQNSITKKKACINTGISTDEKIRQRVAKSLLLQFVKRIVNTVLTWLGLGMTIKAYYIKG